MEPELFFRGVSSLTALLEQVRQRHHGGSLLSACRNLAVDVEQSARDEFGDLRQAELARAVRRSIHDNFSGAKSFQPLEELLDALLTRRAKQEGKETFKAASQLYLLLCDLCIHKPRTPYDLLPYLLGQSRTPGEGATSYLRRWRQIFPNTSTSLSEAVLQTTRQAVAAVLVECRQRKIASVLEDDTQVFGYAVANILPEQDEAIPVRTLEALPKLLQGEFAAWYFVPSGQAFAEARLRAVLGARRYPLYYERFLAHWLLQYGLLALGLAGLPVWPESNDPPPLTDEFEPLFDQFVLTEGYHSGRWDFAFYTSLLADLHFRKSVTRPHAKFRAQFLKASGLERPSDLLGRIRESPFFTDAPWKPGAAVRVAEPKTAARHRSEIKPGRPRKSSRKPARKRSTTK